jgi:hypothetical protein
MVAAPVIAVSVLSIASVSPKASAQSLVTSNLCPGKQKVALGPSSVTEIQAAWQPGANLLDNQQAAETNTRPWEFSIWSPGFSGNAEVNVGLGGQVELDGVVLVSPTFGDAGGVLGIVVNGVSKTADVGPVGSARFTAITGRTAQIRVTRTGNTSANVAELIVCGHMVGDPPTTTTQPPTPGGCTADPNPVGNPGSVVTVCLPFNSGNRSYKIRALQASYGTAAPPVPLKGPGWDPTRPGECSAAEHDRYWIQAADGNYYRTWHPPTGAGCTFGHEHGDDPRNSNLYTWSGGVPFAYANQIAGVRGEEDHVGHKITVQNGWEAVTANAANASFSEPANLAGFTCHWLSHIHQGTHGPDASEQNAHEYHVNVACDDGFARKPTNPTWETASGPNNHTEVSMKLLAAFGEPGSFKACAGKEFVIPNGRSGGLSSLGDDTHRVLPCVESMRRLATALAPTASESRDDGTEELWRPGGILSNDSGQAVKINAYYQVWDPIRLYNRNRVSYGIDRDGNAQPDEFIYSIDMCTTEAGKSFLRGQGATFCDNLPAELLGTPKADWWKSPYSPFRGMKRSIHSKGVTLDNGNGPEFRCTNGTGRGSYAIATLRSDGTWVCPDPGTQILQRLAQTNNLWNYPNRAAWGPNNARGNIQGSSINKRADGRAAGYGFEWIRFYNELDNAGIHAPN